MSGFACMKVLNYTVYLDLFICLKALSLSKIFNLKIFKALSELANLEIVYSKYFF